MINREYKDRLFTFIFGSEEHKEWTLSLYNAVNGSDYDDLSAIEINTIKDVLYMGMKNDVSFIVGTQTINLYEQQSTYNPNMPLRELIYAGHLYDKYVKSNDLNIYSESIVRVPLPKLVVFYNGLKENEDETTIELKDAFPKGTDADESDIQVRVRMLNINYGRNAEMLEACRPLLEYSKLVYDIRDGLSKGKTIEQAVNDVLDNMLDDSVLKEYLIANRAEVESMVITEYDEEKTMSLFKKEYLEQGEAIGEERAKKQLLEKLVKAGDITPERAAELRK